MKVERGDTPAPSASETVGLPENPAPDNDAVPTALSSSDVRPEAVARARELMASGRLGADPEAIAERIINALLKSRDTPS